MALSNPLDETLAVGITGASGFIGRFLCSQLPNRLRVRAHFGRRGNDPGGFAGDLADIEKLSHFLNGLDTVVHLANDNFPRDSKADSTKDVQDNLTTTIQLFENYGRLNPRGHIIFFSSGGTVYDSTLPHIPRLESDKTQPQTSYGIQKLAAEQFLGLFCAKAGMKGTIFRLSNPYGTPLDSNRSQGIVGIAISCAMAEKPFTLFGSPTAVRDYIHMEDVSSAVLKAIESPPAPGVCRTFNLGVGVGIETATLLEKIQHVTGKKLEIKTSEIDRKEVPWNVLDISLIKKELSWAPQISLAEGLSSTFRLANRQRST
jgi:UDP-glucose 4-epimerase